jgi:hypothetical protein
MIATIKTALDLEALGFSGDAKLISPFFAFYGVYQKELKY